MPEATPEIDFYIKEGLVAEAFGPKGLLEGYRPRLNSSNLLRTLGRQSLEGTVEIDAIRLDDIHGAPRIDDDNTAQICAGFGAILDFHKESEMGYIKRHCELAGRDLDHVATLTIGEHYTAPLERDLNRHLLSSIHVLRNAIATKEFQDNAYGLDLIPEGTRRGIAVTTTAAHIPLSELYMTRVMDFPPNLSATATAFNSALMVYFLGYRQPMNRQVNPISPRKAARELRRAPQIVSFVKHDSSQVTDPA